MMKNKHYIIFFSVLVGIFSTSPVSLYAKKKDYKVKKKSSKVSDARYVYSYKGKKVGSVEYTKMPKKKWYYLHELYVKPKQRKKGHGSYIVKHICKLLEKKKKASKLFLEVYPFEEYPYENPYLDKSLRTKRVKELALFYSKFDFKPACYSSFDSIKHIFIGKYELMIRESSHH